MKVHVAQLVPPLRLVGGEVHGALPPGQMLRQRGDSRIVRTHFGQQQCLVGRAQPVATAPGSLQSPPARSGRRGPPGGARESQAREREGRIQIEGLTEPGDRVGVVGAAIRRLSLEVEPERGQRTVDQAGEPARRAGLLGDELGDQPVHQLGQAVRHAFDLRLGPRPSACNRKQRGVERQVIGRTHDAAEQELTGAEPAGQPERVALREIVRLASPRRGARRP